MCIPVRVAPQELTGLKQSYGALKSAEQRFRTSREAVAGLKTTPDGEAVRTAREATGCQRGRGRRALSSGASRPSSGPPAPDGGATATPGAPLLSRPLRCMAATLTGRFHALLPSQLPGCEAKAPVLAGRSFLPPPRSAFFGRLRASQASTRHASPPPHWPPLTQVKRCWCP